MTTPRTLLRAGSADGTSGTAFSRWQELISTSFVPVEGRLESSEDFRGEVTQLRLGDVHLSRVQAGAHEVRRTRRMIARDDPGVLKVCLQVRGQCRITQGGREALLGPGDLALHDTSVPYTLALRPDGAADTFVLMFPRDVLGLPSLAVERARAVAVPGGAGLGGVVSPFLLGLAGLLCEEPGLIGEGLARRAIGLVELLLCERGERTGEDLSRMGAVRLAAVRAWLDQHLADPDLSPGRVAAVHHISVRYLHRLFADDGWTMTRWVKERRLERCRRDLADPALAGCPISALAAARGLTDAAGFSRAFKQSFGLSPREYRLRARAGARGGSSVSREVGLAQEVRPFTEGLRPLDEP